MEKSAKSRNFITRIIKPRCIYAHLAFICSVAAALRYWLIFISKHQNSIANHVEVSTPLNSWKRVQEGLYLYSIGINPYHGDILHEAPISMFFYQMITEKIGLSTGTVFITFDIITACVLFLLSKEFMFSIFIEQEVNKDKIVENSKDLLYTYLEMRRAPLYVAATFLFNPYTLFCCVGFSTTVFFNCFLSLFLYTMLKSKNYLSSLFFAICTVMNFYSAVLVAPLWLQFNNSYKTKVQLFLSILFCIINVSGLFFICHRIDPSNSFIESVYGFILTIPDLKPNIGLFWYFFTEMFDHFRELFIFSFQINATILYLIPLTLKFRNNVFILTTALLYLLTIFKSYPSIGDVGFVLSFVPCFKHLFNYSQQAFLIGVMFIVNFCLGPIVWHLWIYSNSANANFFFGVTLAFAVAQIFLVTEIGRAHV